MEDLMPLIRQAAEENIHWDRIGAALSSFAIPMSRTEQTPIYHGEGDVWTHTKMVCETLVQLEGYRRLPEGQRQAVFLAALLHDIGKISTTRWEDGRWTSPYHTLVGSKMARQYLWQSLDLCGTPEKQQFRETVCNLIRYHSFPPHALDDPNGKRKLLAIAANGAQCPMFTMELLCILCHADALGRKSVDQAHMLEQIDLCAELAEESGCYRGPFPFPSAHTQFSYLSGRTAAPEAALYDDTWGQVILLSGLPGTGKDTWIKANCPGLPMISLDEIRKELHVLPTDKQNRVVELARERARELLRKRQPFVWNATSISPMLRSRQIQLFTQYNAAVRIVYLETAWEEEIHRNASRPEKVPERVICRMLEDLVPPEAKEAHRVLWHTV